MAVVKQLVKAGAEQVLKKLPIDQADTIVKHFNFKPGSPHEIFVRDGGIHPTDGPGLVNAIKKGEAQDLGQRIDHVVQGEEGAYNDIARIADNSTNDLIQDTSKAQQADAIYESQTKNTTTGISAADKQVADELAGSPEGIKWFEERLAREQELDQQILSHKERGKKGYSRKDPKLFAHKGRELKAIAGAVRSKSDNLSTARPQWISEFISDPVRAETGYGKGAGVQNPQRVPEKGFKPTNKDLQGGKTYTDLLSQHHLLFNREGSALFQQQLFKQDPGFVIAMQRYIAKRYDAAFGEAAQNMANLPEKAVHKPYHDWLRELKLDGVSGKNYEQFWKQKLLENENMTAQQLQDAVDEWFEEIIFPSIVVLDDLLGKADPTTFAAREVSFPKSLLKQARASIQNELNPIKPRAKKGSTAADTQIDDLQARAEAGEFGPGRRSWFKDSKARNRAKEIVQQ